MIVVFIPALMLEVFSIYFAIKAFTSNLPVRTWGYCDFAFWNLTLVSPTIAAIHIGGVTAQEGKNLRNAVGKYSNNRLDAETFSCVNFRYIFLVSKMSIFEYFQAHTLFNKMSNRPVVLSCGFFNIDWPLGLSIVSTITAYIIIIGQFEHDL